MEVKAAKSFSQQLPPYPPYQDAAGGGGAPPPVPVPVAPSDATGAALALAGDVRGGGYGTGADPFLATSKACVRADGPRCGRLEAGKMLALCARYQLSVPEDMAAAARRKGQCSYTIFIDRLRQIAGVVA